ncbi:pseudouridine synthase [Nanoarchaeota archaeon]
MLERVQKIIANSDYCSRRKAEELIKSGKVVVNDEFITIGDKADPEKDTIYVEGNELNTKIKKLYILFYKPQNCVTTLSDPQGRRTIFHYINIKERVIPVGRLDVKSEGILLLTNDGDFANSVMHPRYEVTKTYEVEVSENINKKDLAHITQGVQVSDKKGKFRTRPAKARFIKGKKNAAEIIIHEGKNQIIKRMMKALGYSTTKLKRTKIGNLTLGNLKLGEHRDLTKEEIRQLTKSTS